MEQWKKVAWSDESGFLSDHVDDHVMLCLMESMSPWIRAVLAAKGRSTQYWVGGHNVMVGGHDILCLIGESRK